MKKAGRPTKARDRMYGIRNAPTTVTLINEQSIFTIPVYSYLRIVKLQAKIVRMGKAFGDKCTLILNMVIFSQEKDIRTAAIPVAEVREPPDVPQTYCVADTGQEELHLVRPAAPGHFLLKGKT